MLDSDSPAFLQPNEPSIVMFVALRGVDKTDVCVEYGRYHEKKVFKPASVCADTDALDRLKKAVKDDFPVYQGSSMPDPALLAVQGIEKLRKEGRDLTIVDTSSRHEECAGTVKPNLVIFVMDSSIGREAAYHQAQALKGRWCSCRCCSSKVYHGIT